jgi:hypothetical protein
LSVFNVNKIGVRIDGRNLEKSSRDLAWINLRRNDTLALHQVSVGYLVKLHEMQEMDKRKRNMIT